MLPMQTKITEFGDTRAMVTAAPRLGKGATPFGKSGAV
jgi:hypothetical protein